MTSVCLAALVSSAWISKSAAQQAPTVKATAKPAAKASGDPAKRFIDTANEDLRRLIVKAGTADWVKNTYITDDTELLAAAANDELLGYTSQAIKKAARFTRAHTDADTRRMLTLLRVSSSLAGPSDPKARLELTSLAAKMEALYGKAKACGKDGTNPKCLDIEALNGLFQKSRNEAELPGSSSWPTRARARSGSPTPARCGGRPTT